MAGAEAAVADRVSVLRRGIASVDRALVGLLAARRRLVLEVWEEKLRLGLPLNDPGQESIVLDRARGWAVQNGLDAEVGERLLRHVLALTKGVERPAEGAGRPGIGEGRR